MAMSMPFLEFMIMIKVDLEDHHVLDLLIPAFDAIYITSSNAMTDNFQ